MIVDDRVYKKIKLKIVDVDIRFRCVVLVAFSESVLLDFVRRELSMRKVDR
jgi:hypothetical protein